VPAAATIQFDPSARRDLGVAWMTRGHALQQDGKVLESLAAYEQAIAALGTLAVATHPAWANSLGAAWMNHGRLIHRAYGLERASTALASYAAAETVLRPVSGDEYPWARRNLTGTLLNRANLLLDLARWEEASAAAREALRLSLPHERVDPVDADLALKSRRALCDTIGQLLVAPGADQNGLAAEASDQVDDALALIRHWSERGENSFQPLALRLFRYGTQLYRFHQPHFLAEFIQENLPVADGELQTIALDAINATLADRPRELIFLTMGDRASERHLDTSRELEALRLHLVA
jgi:tetratricopeptide (TPR) repeat protein